MILDLVREAVAAGARQGAACGTLGVDPRTVQRWIRAGIGEDERRGPKTAPKNKLSSKERRQLLEIVNSPRYRSLSPCQIVPLLADEGMYFASESTLYRILREEEQLAHRDRAKPKTPRKKPDEHRATGPNQVWTWDITYLPTRVRGLYFYLYVVLDVFSRKIVGWEIHDAESGELAQALFHETCKRERIHPDQIVVHSDNGSPMKSQTLLTLFYALGILTSFSRPSVSNDNPFVEAFFRTLKYDPSYPTRPFDSLRDARNWASAFVRQYNHVHLHSAIRYVTPEARHRGEDIGILAHRDAVYRQARKRRPERWSGNTRNWTRITEVRLNPVAPHAATAAA